MERMMSRHWPGFRAFCILLLSLENGAFGDIDTGNLKKIVNYIRDYGINNEYAVAVRLDEMVCKDPSPPNLMIALPPDVMAAMQEAIEKKNGIYDQDPKKNVVAARPNFEVEGFEHAEWRLLSGGQNSLVAQMLNNKPSESCLIFFTKCSPCTKRCLNPTDERNITKWVNDLFNKVNKDSRAFAFEKIFRPDSDHISTAWPTIKDAPLFRCNTNKNIPCLKCVDNNGGIEPKCLPSLRETIEDAILYIANFISNVVLRSPWFTDPQNCDANPTALP